MPEHPSRPDDVVAVLETLVDQIAAMIEQLRATQPRQGDDKPPAPARTPPPWITTSKASLLRALGRSRQNVGFLKTLEREGVLELRRLDAQRGNDRYSVRFTDPARHAEAWQALRASTEASILV